MDVRSIANICLEAFKVVAQAFNSIVSFLPYTVDDALLALYDEVPLLAGTLSSLVGVVGIGDLRLLEVVFGGVVLVLVGSFAKWLRDLLP